MVASVTQLKSVPLNEIKSDIENTLNARERVVGVITLLAAKREEDKATFLKGFAAELAAVKGDPDKGFVDAQFAKYTTWEKADVDLYSRITAMTKIETYLGERFGQFAKTYRTETVAYLRLQIDAIAVQVTAEDSETIGLTKRKNKLQAELDKLVATPTRPANKPARKKAARKGTAKRASAKRAPAKKATKRTAKKQ